MIDLEKLSDEELTRLEAEYKRLYARHGNENGREAGRHELKGQESTGKKKL